MYDQYDSIKLQHVVSWYSPFADDQTKETELGIFSSVTSVHGIFGLGIVNNILFAVVGFNSKTTRKMPNINTDSEWTQINYLTVITVGYDRNFDVSKVSLSSVNESKNYTFCLWHANIIIFNFYS